MTHGAVAPSEGSRPLTLFGDERIRDAVILGVPLPRGLGGGAVLFIAPACQSCELNERERVRLRTLVERLHTALRLYWLCRRFNVLLDKGEAGEVGLVPREPSALFAQIFRQFRALGSAEMHAPKALTIWEELLDGRWALVAHADANDRRYVIIRQNGPGRGEAVRKLLSMREQMALSLVLQNRSLKVIAGELNVAVSTAATLIGSGIQKLGLQSRRELVQVLGAKSEGM
jgi:DNA-binding CsgD family transcriptional regulator